MRKVFSTYFRLPRSAEKGQHFQTGGGGGEWEPRPNRIITVSAL